MGHLPPLPDAVCPLIWVKETEGRAALFYPGSYEMSELIDNRQKKKQLLKHMILQLREGHAPEAVRSQLARVMGEVPYELVVEVEQELISEGLPIEEVLRLCDVHTAALRGQISHAGAKQAPPGHPVHTFKEENRALKWEIEALRRLFGSISTLDDGEDAGELMAQVQVRFHALTDVEKHYLRKENLFRPRPAHRYGQAKGLPGLA